MDANKTPIIDYFFQFRVDQVSKQYEFEVEYRNQVKFFKTSATFTDIIKNIHYFIYLVREQNCIIYTITGFPKLEQKFDPVELDVTINGLLLVCKIKSGQRLKHREKNINKFRGWLKVNYGIRIEVEVND